VLINKDRGITVSISTVGSVAAALVSVWAFGGPLVEKALAGEVQKQIAPIASAFEVTMSTSIRNLRNSITALEFKRDMCGNAPDCWTIRDAQDLTAARADLRAAEIALSGLREARRP
jgi:hypothetical protein